MLHIHNNEIYYLFTILEKKYCIHPIIITLVEKQFIIFIEETKIFWYPMTWQKKNKISSLFTYQEIESTKTALY